MKALKITLAAGLFLYALTARAFIAGHDCTGPTIAPTGTRIVNVSTISQLNSAVGNLQNGDTIVLANGTYSLTNSLVIHRSNVTIMGNGPGCGGAILQGGGQDNTSGPAEFGVWTDATSTTIAQLTIRDTWENEFICNAGCQSPHVYNVKFINSGSQFVKINGSNSAQIAGAIIEYSRFEYTGGGPNNHGAGAGYGYYNGISAHGTAGLIVRDNTFINLHVADTCLSEPYVSTGNPNCWNSSVLVWNGSTDPIVERNLFINNDQGISAGLIQRSGFLDCQRAIVRNNVLYNAPGFWTATRVASANSDGFIRTFECPNSKVYNNTVVTGGTYGRCVVNRFGTSTGVLISNNLCDVGISTNDLGASATVSNNVTNATTSFFANQTNADFHLIAAASTAIGTGANLSSVVPTDFDRVARTAPFDLGAYKYSTGGTIAAPTNLRIVP
jgi:hypothetical protein